MPLEDALDLDALDLDALDLTADFTTSSNDALISPAVSTPSSTPSSTLSHQRSDTPIRLGVMASGSGSNFEAIANAITRGELNAHIAVVIYNNPSATVADRASRLGIESVLMNHRHFDSREALDDEIAKCLQSHRVSWVIMAGWMRRVTQQLLNAFPSRILNIHPSLLPSFPGLHAAQQALNAGVKITGCSVHIVELVVDSGPIIMQAAVPVRPDDTLDTLQARIQQQEHRIFPQAIALATGQTQSEKPKPQ